MASPTLTDKQLKKKYGLRPSGTPIDGPFELGYKCPKGHADIDWSEFNNHLWCYECKVDYLSFDCPIKRPCWMSKKQWSCYNDYPNKYNIKKGRIHPYPDCKENGKFHKCTK